MKTQLPIVFLTFANDKVDDALYLRNLPKELNSIRNALEKAEKGGLCEVLERTAATVEDIFDTFQDERYKDRIAIFHYGGHASGNQLMLETLSGEHGAAHSDGLVSLLGKQKGLQLAFFNGCSSQEQALELSEAGIPAVVGTATAIKDEVATELADRFYNGIASGATIHQAWLQAVDILKTKNDTKKRKGLKLRRDKNNQDFPWSLYIREGAEIVKEWNLPNAAKNPLFGLPQLPVVDLPEEPFLFLRRYEPKHAEIFFGRDNYIRQLYDRISSTKSAPVILFYGQSGAGKSSTLDSGLLPRLKNEADVKYKRRDPSIGLLGSLDEVLGGNFRSAVIRNETGDTILVSDVERQLATIQELQSTLGKEEQSALQVIEDRLNHELNKQNVSIETDATLTRLERWLSIEKETGRPFHILLDQVEEVFTRYNPAIAQEIDTFLLEVQQIFANPVNRPLGKIILSYRKEYHPEIEELCKIFQIPRESIFLKKLERGDIIEIVNGINATERLQQRYKMAVETELPAIIADDMLEDKDSPIAPVLSILLTKLYQLAQKENSGKMTVDYYQELKRDGILMADFFHQQMGKLQTWKPEIVSSGLALDILNFHTTALGTADSRPIDELKQRYKHHGNSIEQLLKKFQELYLLTETGVASTDLAHDTIAPIVIKEIRESDKPGQRALRILTSKMNDFKTDHSLLLDSTDLRFVEEGVNGMRLWNSMEEKLINASRKKRTKQNALRRMIITIGAAAVMLIIGLGVFSFFQANKAQKQKTLAVEAAKEAEEQEAIANKEAEKAKEQEKIAADRLIEVVNARANEKRVEFENLVPRAKSILQVGGCPDDIFKEMKKIMEEYPDNDSFKNIFQQLYSKNKACQ